MGSRPGDQHDEEPRQKHLGRVERRLRPRHAHSHGANLLRPLAVAVEERLLAADSAEDAEAGSGVGPERGEPADLVALLALPLLQRLDHDGERQRQDGHPEKHEQAELRRGREQDHRDDDVGDDPAEEPGEDVERAAGTEGVVRDRRDHLAGGELAADGVAGARGVVADHLDEAVRGGQPEEEAHRRPGVRPPRIGDRKVDHGRTRGLYAILCGSSASGPRVSVTQSAYSPQEPSNHVTWESPSKARM